LREEKRIRKMRKELTAQQQNLIEAEHSVEILSRFEETRSRKGEDRLD